MTLSLILACLWAVLANVLAMIPPRGNGVSQDNSSQNHRSQGSHSDESQWRIAYMLIAAGIPLLGYVTYENGPWLGLIALFAGMSVLRWPARHFVLWLHNQLRGAREEKS